MKRKLISTISNIEYPFERLEEFAENGESLEVKIENIADAKLKKGDYLWQRFADFLPFDNIKEEWSLGEGGTPLLKSKQLSQSLGLDTVLLKNETTNPTWSFKDRGSFFCIAMAKEMGEEYSATISTGNMGASMAAYGARSGIKSIIFIPSFCPEEKIRAIAIHGATIIKVDAPDYGEMKKKVLSLAGEQNLRIVSGNGPVRVEGYKLTAFEMFEQLNGEVPDSIVVPTSACGHIRGIFKGYKELFEAKLIKKLPRMIFVQAASNSPLVSAWKKGEKKPIPFFNFQTIAEAITTGNPMGGDEILHKAYEFNWLAEEVSEEEILAGQKELAKNGFFVEPASATSVVAIRKLVSSGKIHSSEKVVIVLTGSGLKDSEVFQFHKMEVFNSSIDSIESDLGKLLSK